MADSPIDNILARGENAARLEKMQRIAKLPWRLKIGTISNGYNNTLRLLDTDLTDEQRELIAPFLSGKHEKGLWRTEYTEYGSDNPRKLMYQVERLRDYGYAALHDQPIEEHVNAENDRRRDEILQRLSELPWRLNRYNDLYLPAESVKARSDSKELEEILKNGGYYRLSMPGGGRENNPLGDQGWMYNFILEHGETAGVLFQALEVVSNLDWRYDHARKAFILTPSEDRREKVNIVLGESQEQERIMSDFPSFALHSRYDKTQPDPLRDAVEEFKDELRSRIIPANLDGMEKLPWRVIPEGIYLDAKDVGEISEKQRQLLGMEAESEGEAENRRDIILSLDYIKTLPYFLALEPETQRRNREFLKAHRAEIENLPWAFALAEEIDNIECRRGHYNQSTPSVSLHQCDLENVEARAYALIMEMVKIGLLTKGEKSGTTDAISDDDRYLVSDPGLISLLSAPFKAAQEKLVTELCALPWKFGNGMQLPREEVTDTMRDTIRRSAGRLDFDREDSLYNYYVAYQHDKFVIPMYGIFHKVENRRACQPDELPPEFLNLPWHFAGGRGNEIILNKKDVPDEIWNGLLTRFPLLAKKVYEEGFSLREHQYCSDYPYYRQVLPKAEEALRASFKEITKLPWQKYRDGTFYVVDSDLDEMQKELIRSLPERCFDLSKNYCYRLVHLEERARHYPYIMKNAPENRELLNQIGSAISKGVGRE